MKRALTLCADVALSVALLVLFTAIAIGFCAPAFR